MLLATATLIHLRCLLTYRALRSSRTVQQRRDGLQQALAALEVPALWMTHEPCHAVQVDTELARR
jgi:hypothetical protein